MLSRGSPVDRWTVGLRVSWDSLGRDVGKVGPSSGRDLPFSPEFGFLPAFGPRAPLNLWRWVFDGLMAPGMSLGVAGAGYYLGAPPAVVSLCSPVCEQMSFITKPKAGCRTCRTPGPLGQDNNVLACWLLS